MLFLALAAMAAVSDDWPQLLGPHRNGVYTGETVGWPSQFAWQKEVGSGFASPVIVGGKVILFHRKGDREIVEAFEAATGKTVWTFDSPTHYRDDFGFDNGPRATPTVAGGRVFTFGAEGLLHALDLETGAMLWRLDVNQKFDVPKGWFGAGCSPLVYEGKLYLNIGSKKAGVGAFDPATGNVLWTSSHHETSTWRDRKMPGTGTSRSRRCGKRDVVHGVPLLGAPDWDTLKAEPRQGRG